MWSGGPSPAGGLARLDQREPALGRALVGEDRDAEPTEVDRPRLIRPKHNTAARHVDHRRLLPSTLMVDRTQGLTKSGWPGSPIPCDGQSDEADAVTAEEAWIPIS